jgi:hypothetical protein
MIVEKQWFPILPPVPCCWLEILVSQVETFGVILITLSWFAFSSEILNYLEFECRHESTAAKTWYNYSVQSCEFSMPGDVLTPTTSVHVAIPGSRKIVGF